MKLILFLCVIIVHVAVGKLLSNEGTCHRSDPNLDSCLLKQAGQVVKQLQNGIPEYNMESIDPLQMDFMKVEADLEQFKINMAITNMTFYGHGDAIFHKIKFDPTSLTGEVSFTIPILTLICDYLATGKLYTIPLESNAHFNGNFTDMGVHFFFRLQTVQRKGVEYFTVSKLAGTISFENTHMKLTSIDPARQSEVQLIENFGNANNKLITQLVNPVSNEYMGHLYKYVIERYLRKIPATDLLPF